MGQSRPKGFLKPFGSRDKLGNSTNCRAPLVINPKLLLFSTLRIAYFVLRKGATQYAVRNTQYETLFQGQEAFEL